MQTPLGPVNGCACSRRGFVGLQNFVDLFTTLPLDEQLLRGLNRDSDQPEHAEDALTGVRRTWRGRGIAAHLKRQTLH